MSGFRLAYLSLTRRWVSSLIAVAAIAISVACSGVLYRLNRVSMSRFSSIAAGGDAVIGAKAGGIEILLGSLNLEGPYPGFLPFSLFRSLRQQQAVKFEDGAVSQPAYLQSVIPILFFATFKSYRVLGTDESFFKRPKPEDSLIFAQGNWAKEMGEIVLGSAVADREGLRVGDAIEGQAWTRGEIPLSGFGQARPLTFKIAGILAETGSAWDRGLYSNLATAHRVLEASDLGEASIWKAEVLNYFLIYFNPQGFESLQSLINRRTVGQLISVEKEKIRLEELTGTGRKLGISIIVFILLLGGLAMAAMLITRFEGMLVQLAVLRAIGYKKREVASWLLFEGLLLGMVACFVGGLVDAVSFPILRGVLSSALPGEVTSNVWQSAPVWGIAILATVGAVTVPIIRLYREDVHNALKGL